MSGKTFDPSKIVLTIGGHTFTTAPHVVTFVDLGEKRRECAEIERRAAQHYHDHPMRFRCMRLQGCALVARHLGRCIASKLDVDEHTAGARLRRDVERLCYGYEDTRPLPVAVQLSPRWWTVVGV